MKDKKIIFLLVLFILVFEYRFIYVPSVNKIESMDELIVQKQSDLQLLKRMAEEYRSMSIYAGQDSARLSEQDFSLFAYIGDMVEGLEMARHVRGITPLPPATREGIVTERLRMNVENVTLQQVYNLLDSIESGDEAIYVPEFRMRRQRERQSLLNAEMEIITFKRAG